MFFRRKKLQDALIAGATFKRVREHDITELATVTWVGEGPFGIPHVRFQVDVPGHDDASDTRILAVSAFMESYTPAKVAAA